MLDLTEAQLVELILAAAKRGYSQATADAQKRVGRERDRYAQEGIEEFRKRSLEVLRRRVSELKELKANALLITGFNEAVEFLEYGLDASWEKIREEREKSG